MQQQPPSPPRGPVFEKKRPSCKCRVGFKCKHSPTGVKEVSGARRSYGGIPAPRIPVRNRTATMRDVTRVCNRVDRQQAQNHNNALIKIDILQDWIAEVSDNHDILMQDLERRLSTARPAHHLPGANGPPPAILDDGSEHIEIQDGSPEHVPAPAHEILAMHGVPLAIKDGAPDHVFLPTQDVSDETTLPASQETLAGSDATVEMACAGISFFFSAR